MRLTERQLKSIIREEVATVTQAPKKRVASPRMPSGEHVPIDWDNLPRARSKSSIARDEEAALRAGDALLQALDRLGDYEHYDQVGRLLSSMRETYRKF